MFLSIKQQHPTISESEEACPKSTRLPKKSLFKVYALVPLFTFLISGCQPENDYYLLDCSQQEVTNYIDPFYYVHGYFVENRRDIDGLSGSINTWRDTVTFELYYISLYANRAIHAYPPEPGSSAVVVDPYTYHCIPNQRLPESGVESVTVTSNFDISPHLKKGDTINSIINVYCTGTCGYELEETSLDTYLKHNDFPTSGSQINFRLTTRPTLSDTFSIKVAIRLKSGRLLQNESLDVIFL